METDEVWSTMRRLIRAETVFAAPIEQAGVTVIPAAVVMGGGGGGRQDGADGGSGGGFGLWARPVGAFVIRDGTVRFKPVIPPVLGAAVVVALVLVLDRRRRARRVYRAAEVSLPQAEEAGAPD